MSNIRKDIAPGESHIALRSKGIIYYAVGLFHLAPSYRKTVPLLITDVLKARCPVQIYGVQGLKLNHEGCILVKNHPIKALTICGRVMSYSSFTFPSKNGKFTNEVVVLTLDDSSDEHSSISVKINPHHISTLNFDKDHIFVEVTGTPTSHTNGERQILAQRARIVGNSTDISLELAWWAVALESRKHLSQPWIYEPPATVSGLNGAINTGPTHRDTSLRHSKEGILRSSINNVNRNDPVIIDLACVTDSFALHKKAAKRRRKSDKRRSNEFAANSHVIGSTSSESSATPRRENVPIVIEIID